MLELTDLVHGVSVGLCQMTLSTYVSEIAPAQIRGALLVAYSFWWAMGQFTCAIAVYILQSMPTETRLYLRAVYASFGFSAVAIVLIALIPESPRWLLRMGRKEKAMHALSRLCGSIPGYDVQREIAVLEYDLASESARREEARKVSYADIFRGTDLRRTLVSGSIMAWQQCVGISIVYGYNAGEYTACPK